MGARCWPTFPRELPGRGAWPFRRPLGPTARSSGRRSRTSLGPRSAATGRPPLGARGGLSRGGRTRQGAQRRARGARSRAPSTPWTGRAIAAPGPPGSQHPGRPADLPSALFFLEYPLGSLQTFLATPPPHFICLPRSPGNVLPGAKKMQQAPRKTAASALQNIPPSPTT